MHHNFRTIVIAVSILFLLALPVWLVSRPLARTLTMPASDPIVEPVKEIAGYRNWTKVNTEPQLMHRRAAIDCTIWLSPALEVVDGETNPHREKYITVYVNAIGRDAMMEKLKPIFAVGSVIVKEKLPERSSQSPELLTVMIKREKGFNSETGDWEYMAVDGTGSKVEARGKLKNCQRCHLDQPKTDYIFRTYLPYDVRKKLN
jgi:cytochrome P460